MLQRMESFFLRSDEHILHLEAISTRAASWQAKHTDMFKRGCLQQHLIAVLSRSPTSSLVSGLAHDQQIFHCGLISPSPTKPITFSSPTQLSVVLLPSYLMRCSYKHIVFVPCTFVTILPVTLGFFNTCTVARTGFWLSIIIIFTFPGRRSVYSILAVTGAGTRSLLCSIMLVPVMGMLVREALGNASGHSARRNFSSLLMFSEVLAPLPASRTSPRSMKSRRLGRWRS
mmetsp:Transcript_1722/g.4095  ORF Transcript_1722/g.4095 Transcript_1722/m.4095 type:complete len:229 (+) Transcript_1722:1491-2177(+)